MSRHDSMTGCQAAASWSSWGWAQGWRGAARSAGFSVPRADEVRSTHECVHITRNGREYVVLLTDTQAQERIATAEADFAHGDVLDEQQLQALIDERHRSQPE